MKKLSLLALVLAAALPLAAVATEKNYTNAEVGYVNIDGQANGAYLRGNYAFGNSGVYLTGTTARVEINGTDFDVRGTEFGLGYHYGLNQRFDLLGEVARDRLSTDFGSASGYRASVGTRFDVTNDFEGRVQVNHYNRADFAATNTGAVSGLYKFGPRWGLAGGVEFDSDGTQGYTLGVSARF